MKKQFELVRNILIICIILTIIEGILLGLTLDLKHIILTCVVLAFDIGIVILYFISASEVKKNILEGNDEVYSSRLVDYDDYQLIRNFLDTREMSNSKEEITILDEYEKMTVDFVRLHFHYLVFKEEELCAVVYCQKIKDKKNSYTVKFVKIKDELKEEIKKYLLFLIQNKKINLEFID